MDVEADVPHQRHERVQDLRHATAERGGAHVENPLAGQRRGALADLLDEPAADQVCVVGERLGAEGNVLKHARQPTFCLSRCTPASSSRRIVAWSSGVAARTHES